MKFRLELVLLISFITSLIGFSFGYFVAIRSRAVKTMDTIQDVKQDFDKAKGVVAEDYGKAKRAVGKQKEELYKKLGIKDATKENVKKSLKERIEDLRAQKFKQGTIEFQKDGK